MPFSTHDPTLQYLQHGLGLDMNRKTYLLTSSSAFFLFPLPVPRLVLGSDLASSDATEAVTAAPDETVLPSPVSYRNSVSGNKTRLYEVD